MTDEPQYPSYPGPEQPQTPPPANQPPPPPGYQPPPYGQAPQGYGQVPGYAPGQPAYAQGQPTGGGMHRPFAGWWSRVGATLLDGLISVAVFVIPAIVGAVIAFKDAEVDSVTGEITGGVAPVGVVILVLAYVAAIAFGIWNTAFRQGRTGQSLGKQIVGIQVVNFQTGQFLGAGMAFVRWLVASIIGGICFIDYLWPLWDDKNQTWHDKIVGSVVTTK